MPKIKAIALLFVCLFLMGASALAEVDTQAAAEAPKRFYQAVNSKDYASAWNLLTDYSKSQIVFLVAQDAKMSEPEVRQLFDTLAPAVADGFWDSFRASSKPDLYTSLTYTFAGDKDGSYRIAVSQPGLAAASPIAELIVKNEGGYKFGLIESNPPASSTPPPAP